MTRHQYDIKTLVPQRSFSRKTSDCVADCWLYSWGAYHLTENFGNSGWKVNGMVIFQKVQQKIEEYVLR